jgi:GntR family transcriptional regulator, transcriptional repressor for pyruvate dehydrogenase complex
LAEWVADEIRLMIDSEALKPGDRIGREEDLARRFGVSRPTLREALRVLSSSHRVTASKGSGGGIFVAATGAHAIGLSISESVASMIESETIAVEELLQTCLLLEVPLAGLAAQHASKSDVAALQALMASTDLGSDSRDLAATAAQVHRLIDRAAGNRLVAAFTTWIVDVLQPSLYDVAAATIDDSVVIQNLRTLVDAVARGDAEASEQAMSDALTYLSEALTLARHVSAGPQVGS